MEPTAANIQAYIDAGHTQIDAAQRFRISRSKIQRILKLAESEDGPGPTERAARALVSTWGDMDESKALVAESLIGFAVLADVGRSRRANGAERGAAVNALKELNEMVGELGQASGFEELRLALLAA